MSGARYSGYCHYDELQKEYYVLAIARLNQHKIQYFYVKNEKNAFFTLFFEENKRYERFLYRFLGHFTI